MKMDLFGLNPNTDYTNCRVSVRHKNGTWFDLLRTTAKMAICDKGDRNGKEKRVHFNSIVEVSGDPSKSNSEKLNTGNTKKNNTVNPSPRKRKTSGNPFSKDTDAEGCMTKEKMKAVYDEIYGRGAENPFFGDDFGMAANPDMVVGPDGEMGGNLENETIFKETLWAI